MKSESTQKITALNEADEKRLQDQRAVIEKFLPDDSSRQNYKKAAGKLGIIRAILDRNLLKPTQHTSCNASELFSETPSCRS